MNEVLVARWNFKVSDTGRVLHLGDFGFQYSALPEICKQLKGKISLVIGNHDYKPSKMTDLGMNVVCKRKHNFTFKYRDREFVVAHKLKHLPEMTEADKRIRLCGHEHNEKPVFIREVHAVNMSVEHWDYSPVTIDTVIDFWDSLHK